MCVAQDIWSMYTACGYACTEQCRQTGSTKRGEGERKGMAIKAVQQFQLGTRLNNEKQALETMRQMKEAGYEGIELCYFMIHPTSVFYRLGMKCSGTPIGRGGRLDWPKLVHEAGMQVPSVHQNMADIEKHTEKTAEEALSLGAERVTLSAAAGQDYSSASAVLSLADRLNRAGEKLLSLGVQLIYHNHSVEFLHPEEGITAYRMLVENTDPRYVNYELDAYWAWDAGADPVQLMGLLGSRLKLMHVTDRGSSKKGAAMTPAIPYTDTELGRGNLNLEPMICKALSLGVDAVILETHKGWIDRDPVKSFQVSGEYLSRFL